MSKNLKKKKKKLPKQNLLKPGKVEADDLWIAAKSNLKGDNGDRAWNDRMATPTGSRLLELADIALGLKKPEPPKKRRAAAGTSKT
ncbi:MAG TPA: hypothetical protein VKT33_08915 [Candidatus Angelobacter sp.]|nr:hypothetical protein [Candidatus Angelobacter sp.]